MRGCWFLTPLSLVASIQCFRNANVSTIDLCFQLLLQANNIPATTEVDVPASNSDQNQEIQPVSEIAAVCNARDSLDYTFTHSKWDTLSFPMCNVFSGRLWPDGLAPGSMGLLHPPLLCFITDVIAHLVKVSCHLDVSAFVLSIFLPATDRWERSFGDTHHHSELVLP